MLLVLLVLLLWLLLLWLQCQPLLLLLCILAVQLVPCGAAETMPVRSLLHWRCSRSRLQPLLAAHSF